MHSCTTPMLIALPTPQLRPGSPGMISRVIKGAIKRRRCDQKSIHCRPPRRQLAWPRPQPGRPEFCPKHAQHKAHPNRDGLGGPVGCLGNEAQGRNPAGSIRRT